MKQVRHSAGGYGDGKPAPGKFCTLEPSQSFDIAYLVHPKY